MTRGQHIHEPVPDAPPGANERSGCTARKWFPYQGRPESTDAVKDCECLKADMTALVVASGNGPQTDIAPVGFFVVEAEGLNKSSRATAHASVA